MAMPRQNSCQQEIASPILLPQDIIEEILSRLPASCLNRLKLVCKSFQSLITSPSFADLQFDRSSEKSFLISTAHGFRSVDTSLCEQFRLDFPVENMHNRVKIIGSCRGLVAFSLNSLLNKPKCFYLWNPFTGQCKKLADLCFQSCKIPFYGLGYDASTNDYKVVYCIEEVGPFPIEKTPTVFFFSWRKNSWKTIESPRIEPKFCFQYKNRSGCYVNGALHWLANDDQIWALDLKTERFSTIPLSPNCGIPSNVAVIDGRLYLTCFTVNFNGTPKYFVEIWAMQEYSVKESWVNLFSLPDSIDYIYEPFFILKNHHMIVSGRKMHFLRLDPETRTVVEKCDYNCFWDSNRECAILVTESLFSPDVEHHQQQQITVKRKREIKE